MKKIFIVILIVFTSFIKGAKAQTNGVQDTLAYLQTIVANKTQFIGQPFSTLMDSLKIQIKFFSPFSGIHYDITKETSTDFSFYFSQNTNNYYLTYPRLEVFWQLPLNATQSDSLWETNGGIWSSAVAAFYANGIIKDIQIRE